MPVHLGQASRQYRTALADSDHASPDRSELAIWEFFFCKMIFYVLGFLAHFEACKQTTIPIEILSPFCLKVYGVLSFKPILKLVEV